MQNCAEDWRFPGAVLGSVGTCPLVCNDRCLGLTVQKTVFSDKALTMSSWSLVGAKMQVKVGIGSCAILGENIETSWVTFAWRLAL